MNSEYDLWVVELFNPPLLYGYWETERGAQINKDHIASTRPDRSPVVRRIVGRAIEAFPVEDDPQPTTKKPYVPQWEEGIDMKTGKPTGG